MVRSRDASLVHKLGQFLKIITGFLKKESLTTSTTRMYSSRVFIGHTVHSRLTPTKHTFRYPVNYYVFDLDELQKLSDNVSALHYFVSYFCGQLLNYI